MKGKKSREAIWNGPYRFWIILGLPALVVASLFFALSISNVYTQTYNLEKYSTSPETIRSPITIENERKTEQQIRKATQSVEDRYTVSEDIEEERTGMITEIFEVVENTKKSKTGEETVAEQVVQVRSLLSDGITDELPSGIFTTLMEAEIEGLKSSEEVLLAALHSSYEDGIRSADLEEAERRLKLKVQYSSVPSSLKQVISDLGMFGLVENALFDPDKTEQARKDAASQVQPVMIRAGEVIVSKGSTITNEIHDELQLTGLLDERRNSLPLVGLALFSLLLGTIIYYESTRTVKKGELNIRHIYVLTIISFFVILMMKVSSLFVTVNQPLYYLVPTVSGAMLIKLLCHERMAVIMSFVYALMSCLLFNGQLAGALNGTAGIYVAISQLAGVFLLIDTKDRLSIVRSSAGVAVINICTILFFLFISFERYTWFEIFTYSGYGIVAAFLAAVLTLGLLPFIEAGFGILSDSKLLNLANPNHPLLRKILVEAPGTYHHSVMVANLSEAACESIGANGLLARVAAYYHDLGKTVRPHYFIENQMGMKNPHDFLDPEQSAEIIIDHPYDGAALLEKEKMPQEIIDIAKQHHGTTLLKYFYYKAKEEDPDIQESDYRYPGPKPQTKEAAIVCICDSVEAAVRSLNGPTEDKIKQIVHSIIEDRLLDGQFDDSHLTFNEIKIFEHAICETLNGIFHSRIQYPETKSLVKEAK